jgi:hypothetical protein
VISKSNRLDVQENKLITPANCNLLNVYTENINAAILFLYEQKMKAVSEQAILNDALDILDGDSEYED